jgi:protein FAM32A
MKPVFVGGSLSFKGDKKAKKKKAKGAKHTLDKKSPTTSNRDDLHATVDAEEEAISFADEAASRDKSSSQSPSLLEADLTDAEKKALKKKREREAQELASLAKKSHRERVEEFNEKLASLTEHNDIPRVCRVHVHRLAVFPCPALSFARCGWTIPCLPFACFLLAPYVASLLSSLSVSDSAGERGGKWLRNLLGCPAVLRPRYQLISWPCARGRSGAAWASVLLFLRLKAGFALPGLQPYAFLWRPRCGDQGSPRSGRAVAPSWLT